MVPQEALHPVDRDHRDHRVRSRTGIHGPDAVLGPVDAIGFRAVTLTVTNNSSERSNYLIDLTIESPDGTTQYDTSAAFVNYLEPGQTRVTQSSPVTVDVPSDAVVTIKTISRLAAN